MFSPDEQVIMTGTSVRKGQVSITAVALIPHSLISSAMATPLIKEYVSCYLDIATCILM